MTLSSDTTNLHGTLEPNFRKLEEVRLPKHSLTAANDLAPDRALANAREIIRTLKNYEPMSIPTPGEKERLIGSNLPCATIKYNGRDVPVCIVYDTKYNSIHIRSVDEEGKTLTEVTKTYDVWYWEVKGPDKINRALDEMRKSTDIGCTQAGDQAVFSTTDESKIPKEFLQKEGIEIKKQRVEKTTPILLVQVNCPLSDPVQKESYTLLEMPDSGIKQSFDSSDAYTNSDFQKALAEIKETIKPKSLNPWLHYTTKELSGPVLERIVKERLYPEQYSQSGFLGPNDNFSDVIRSDREYLRSVGITNFQIADSLNDVLSKAEALYRENKSTAEGVEVELNGQRLRVRIVNTHGFQRNPFQELRDWHIWNGHQKGEFTLEQCKTWNVPYKQYGDIWLGSKYPPRGSADFTITNLDTKQSVSGGDMAPVLMAMGFFEGPGTPYRMNPKDYIKVLGLNSEKQR